MRQVINEGTSSQLTVSFFDAAGAPATPSAVTVQIQCLTSDTEIRAAQAVTPASVVTINISDTENRIVDASKSENRRRVTVSASYGAGDAINDDYDYVVKNLSGVS